MTPIQADIERRLAQSEPDIEVLLAEVVGGRCLRVFIDPDLLDSAAEMSRAASQARGARPTGPGLARFVVASGGGGNASNYTITDPWDASTNHTLGTLISRKSGKISPVSAPP